MNSHSAPAQRKSFITSKVFLVVLFVILALLLLANFAYIKITSRSLYTPEPTTQTSQKNDNSVVANNLKKHVVSITSILPPRNHLNVNSLNKTADYIENEFKFYCPNVSRQKFIVNQKEYSNVICTFGEEKDLVVIGAHYDVDHNSTGADDNASGVAGLLELARLLKENTSQQNISLVAYSLEELPHFRTKNMGSYHHARYLNENKINVKYMLSLEMIGYFSNEENSQQIPSELLKLLYPSTGNFIAIIGRLNKDPFINQLDSFMLKNSDLPVRSLHAPESMLDGHSSDQINYWEFGYEAAMVTDTGPYRNKNYHKVTDTADTLDYVSSAKVVTGVHGFLLQ